jgi:aspartate carbamoyltransferase catalytic subunit
VPSILKIADLADREIDAILDRATEFKHGGGAIGWRPRSLVVSLLFLEPSLRTRVGFTAAAWRLGLQAIDVSERRQSPVSMMESWADTLRTVAGYSDVIVARPALPLGPADARIAEACPVINGGDRGPHEEHPTQALIDLFAMEHLRGPTRGLRIAIVGDPGMRAPRSLLALLGRRLPAALTLIGDEDHLARAEIPAELAQRTRAGTWRDLAEIDVLYVAGMPHASLPLDRRDAVLVTAERIAALPPASVLLSPMPVIDEMDERVRSDPRNRMYVQSDLAMNVRMAVLEHALRDVEPSTLERTPREGTS